MARGCLFIMGFVSIADVLKVDDKCPDALLMLGHLELKNDDWVKAKDTFKAAKGASNSKDSYATVSGEYIILIAFVFQFFYQI